MGQKDLTEKNLQYYPDVFADILNALLYDGKQMIAAEAFLLLMESLTGDPTGCSSGRSPHASKGSRCTDGKSVLQLKAGLREHWDFRRRIPKGKIGLGSRKFADLIQLHYNTN